MIRQQLTPPPQILGRFTSATPERLRHDRCNWIMAAHKDGATFAQIGDAMGLSEARVGQIALQGGYKPNVRRRPSKIDYFRLHEMGTPLGAIGAAFFALPEAVQFRAIDAASRTGKSISAVLCDAFARSHDKPQEVVL